jgi:HK97 family phage major capsid protein
VNGDGTGKPRGFLQDVTAVVAATGNATSFSYLENVNVLHAVPAQYRVPEANPAWIVSDSALKALRQKVDTNGQPIILDPASPGDPVMLLGYPLYVDPDMPAAGANNKSVAFGGWRYAYGIRRVNGVGMSRQDEIHSDNGQIGLVARHRVDGRVLIADAARALQHSGT